MFPFKRYKVFLFDKHQNMMYYTDGRTWETDENLSISFFKFWYLYMKYWRGHDDVQYEVINKNKQ